MRQRKDLRGIVFAISFHLMYMIQSMSYQLDLFFISKTYVNR